MVRAASPEEFRAADASPALSKVALINTADRGGGAERMAIAILDRFETLGTEVALLVGDKRSQDPRVITFHSSPRIDYRPLARRHRRMALQARRTISRRLGLEDFEHPHSRYVRELTGSRPDLLLCMNLHGGFFDLRTISRLSHQLPVVLRLEDSWTMTGHCAVPRGCPRWQTGCGSCPDLEIPPAISRDATRVNWLRKKRIFSAAQLAVVTPSKWMLERAQSSLLAGAVERARVIPNGVDLAILTPGRQDEARQELGIDPEALVLLFVANGGSMNPYKDFRSLRAAIELLADARRDTTLELLVVGREGPSEEIAERARIRHLAHLDSPERLTWYYRAADLYVHASWEESFSLTAAEALACGLPVVATAAGALPEVVDHGITGWLVPVGDAHGLAAGIEELLDDRARRMKMSSAAIVAARERFDSRRQVAELHGWCAEVAADWQAARPPS